MRGNILIVDDQPAALKLLTDILTAEDFSVRPFAHGELALRSIKAEIPDLVLLDIRMPTLSGFDVCRQIKENISLKEIPVIFISAASEMDDKVTAFQLGGVDYITKPFQREEVVARVKTHVALSQTVRELQRLGESLRKSEESLKMAQSIAHLGHWEWDIKSGQVIWSEEMYRILGLDPLAHQVTFDSFLKVVHPDDRDEVAKQLDRAFHGNGFDIEFRIANADGMLRVVHGKGELIRLDSVSQSKFVCTIQEIPKHESLSLLGVMQDVTERKELETRLEQLANTDPLTGCSNRRHFLYLAEKEIAHTRRYRGELSVLVIDIDHFKEVNDKYGHQVGDVALKKVVQVCQHLLREVDVTGRLGGEEFAVLLPETEASRAKEVAERLRLAIAATELMTDTLLPLHVTISVGVASLQHNDTKIDTVLNRADQALYDAKRSGRNKVRM